MEELQKALKAGLNGYKAMTFQVVSLMWLRTIMNYQYKNGGTFKEVLFKLYKEGGIRRFYSGIIPALIQGPLCRFGDTFSNAVVLNFLKQYKIPIFIKTGLASGTAGIIRIILSPVDTIKTMRQVEGKNAMVLLSKKIKENGFLSLYDGALANGILNIIGHYPWFLMHNYLDKYLPISERGRTDHIFKPLRLWNENGKGRELPLWLKDEIYKVKKNYPDIVKKAIEEGKNNL